MFVGNFISATAIVNTVYNFAYNYWFYTGADHTSHLTIGVGTYNSGVPEGQGATDRGNEWARMVNEINQKIAASDSFSGTSIATQVTVLGANDIEDWGTYSAVSTWMQAYMNNSSCVPSGFENKCMVDFGNANCAEVIGSPDETCAGGWTIGQVLLMASAVKRAGDTYRFIVTLPEIYNTGGVQAIEWANVSLWGVNHGYFPIWFAGTLTQWTRCQNPGTHCTGTNNVPSAGWCQLRAALITRPEIEQISFRWIADVNWQDYAGQYQQGITACP